ncbi:MAG: hypothetical protein J5706_01160 [Elusimicrobiales bacterium]|nr:hypothetical protein [Elusimicrobiales bacterium]
MSMEQHEICNFEEDAVLYAYGELPKSEIARFEDHLSKCGICEGTVKTLQTAERAVSAEIHNPSDSTVRFIMAKTDEYSHPGAKQFLFRKKIAAFAFASIAIMALFAVISGGISGGSQFETASISGDDISFYDMISEDEILSLEDEISAEIDLWE